MDRATFIGLLNFLALNKKNHKTENSNIIYAMLVISIQLFSEIETIYIENNPVHTLEIDCLNKE